MSFQLNNWVRHLKSGIEGRVISTSDNNPRGFISVNYLEPKKKGLHYIVIEDYPDKFELIADK